MWLCATREYVCEAEVKSLVQKGRGPTLTAFWSTTKTCFQNQILAWAA